MDSFLIHILDPGEIGLRPDEIGFAFHWASISLGKQDFQG
jgi:hypothetical protein